MISDSPRILVDHSGEKGLGDIVSELGSYAHLRARYPEGALVSRGSRTIAWGHPLIDAFDESSPDDAFDQVLRFPVNAHPLNESLVEGRRIFDHLLQGHDFPPVAEPPRLYVMPDEVDALGLVPDHPDDLIIAYSVDSKEPDRRWGEERFAELLGYLQAQYGGTYLELGSGFTAGHLGIGYDLVGQTDLRQTMALLSVADCFIGNHGGLTHLAGAVGTPILCPWGASTPYAAYAYDDLSVAIETEPPCRHCGWTGTVLDACREAGIARGRTPCTQEISVLQMREAADRLLDQIGRKRSLLRQARETRRQQARDPQRLQHFERPEGLNPFANLRLYLGGRPGWGSEHRRDDFARLRSIVAFPDWSNPHSAWESVIASYVAAVDADAPWVLVLSAAPFAGPEVSGLVSDYLGLLERQALLPKIMLLLGHLSDSERRHLIRQADVYVPLEGPYHLEGVTPARYLTRLGAMAEVVRS